MHGQPIIKKNDQILYLLTYDDLEIDAEEVTMLIIKYFFCCGAATQRGSRPPHS